MAKSQRSKREKQKDFVKKKVKVGKTLQKPQNETITTFKTRSIQILEQLGEKEAGPNVTQKRYSMTELCTRLGQKNPKQKLDACQGIKELFGKLSSDQVRLKLAELVTALSRCLLDDDCKVRDTAVRMLEMLIDKVGIASLQAHFTLLGRHASCGLVSLHCDVQATALQLLHMLLRKAPQLLPLHASTVLPNLLRLLGAKTKSGATLQKVFTEGIGGATPTPKSNTSLQADKNNKKQQKSTKTEEEVVVSPGQMSSRHNSLMWQLDVLVLLSGVLQRVIQFDPGNPLAQDNTPKPISRWQLILESSSPRAAASSVLRVPGDGVAHFSNLTLLCEPSKLRSLTTTILTLVYTLWRNFLPPDTQLKGDVEMSHPSAHCLWCLVDLQRSLSTLVSISSQANPEQCEWFYDLIVKIYGDLLMNHFPFHYSDVRADGPKKTKSKSRYEDRPSLSSDDLNVRLATVGVQFRLFNERRNRSLVQYVEELIMTDEKIGEYKMESLCWLIKSLVDFFSLDTEVMEAEHLEVVERLVRAALACYRRQHPLKKERRHLLDLLLTLTDADHRQLQQLQSVRQWCEVLVTELTTASVLPPSLLCAARQLALRRCPGLKCEPEILPRCSENILANGMDWSDLDKSVFIGLL